MLRLPDLRLYLPVVVFFLRSPKRAAEVKRNAPSPDHSNLQRNQPQPHPLHRTVPLPNLRNETAKSSTAYQTSLNINHRVNEYQNGPLRFTNNTKNEF